MSDAAATALAHVAACGLAPAEGLVARELTGGVSCDVVAVTGGGLDVVVKRALPRLRVEAEWLADDRRALIEARALQLAGRVAPGRVPRVLDVDERRHTIVIERAPAAWREWRQELLAGRVDPAVGAALGAALATWHAIPPAELAGFEDTATFVQLRVDPFHRTTLLRHPDLAPRIEVFAAELLEQPAALVHG